ncbi:hypothetical protein B7P43_G12923 [Cryptotermes secundus]|uniref:Uncharacterized protein n=1 Tax=Cryptotermes secundus TaxID=105785 RepID=A0A2J7Q8D4_9NEOP|nr:hypothetical protein B7P43_G12923 [Cryptotermes secundus]
MIINPIKSKAVCFMRAQVMEPLNYSIGDTVISEASSCKYLGILCSNLGWADQVNYTVEKAWKVLHLTMSILKKGNNNTKCLAYASSVRPTLESKGKYSFVNRTIQIWNQLPADALWTLSCIPSNFRKRVFLLLAGWD